MNILLLLDNKINEAQLSEVKSAVADIYKRNCEIKLVWKEEWRDFSNVPKEWYTKEEEGIKKTYIQSVTTEIYKRYAEEIDEVVFFIHRDNWNLTGVWGWNLSKAYNGYGVQQCRFDSKNLNNSIGTLYHEFHHDHDTFIQTYTGVKVEGIVGVVDWDDDITHGGKYSGTTYGWEYIRFKENQESLRKIKPYLREALKVRRELYTKKVIGLMQKVILLQKQLIVLLRQKQTELRGDLPIKPVL